MKHRSVLMALVLFAVAAFLLLAQNGMVVGGAGNPEGKQAGSQPIMRSSGGADDAGRQRRLKSKRVLREKPTIVTTESGLKYEVIAEGQGERPGPKSMVEVHYVGALEDGTVFDSSRERGQAAKFGLHQVIKGWTEGLQLMRPGAQYRFTIPPELGYGSRAPRGEIPLNATLIFEVELLGIEGE